MKLPIRKYSNYIKNAGIYLTATLFSSALSVIINPFLAKNLSPEDYGCIGYYQGLGNFFSPIIGFFILDFYLRKFYNLNELERGKLKSSILKIYFTVSLFISFFSLLSIGIFQKISNSSIPFLPYAPLIIFQLYLSFLFSFKLAEYRIEGKAKQFAYVTVANGCISTFFSVILVVICKYGATGKMTASLMSSLIMFLFVIHSYKDYHHGKIQKTFVIEWLKFATPMVIAGVLGFFTDGYDRVFLERNGDISSLGVYSVGFQMASYLSIFATSIKSTFQPDIFKAIAEKNIRKIVKINALTLLLIAIVVTLFIIVCPFIIYLLTAGRYVSSSPFARILALSIITSNFYYLVSQTTFTSGLSQLTLVNKVIGAGFTILLFSILIPKYGSYGAAWGVVTSFLFSGITNILLLYYKKDTFLK